MQKLEIWIEEFSFKFYAIRIENEKIRDFNDVLDVFGGWNPFVRNEHEIKVYIDENQDLFEDYEVEYIYFDVE